VDDVSLSPCWIRRNSSITSSTSSCSEKGVPSGFVSSDDVSFLVSHDHDLTSTTESLGHLRIQPKVWEKNESDKEYMKESIFNSSTKTFPRITSSTSFCHDVLSSSTDGASLDNSNCQSSNCCRDRSQIYTKPFLSKCLANGCQIESDHVQRIYQSYSTNSVPSSSVFEEHDEDNFVTKL